MKKEEQKQSWQINSSFKRSRESARERKSRTKLDIDSVRGQAYEGTQRCCVPKGVRSVGRRHCKFWGATKYGRINMFKIFMCPSAVQLLLWRRHFVFSGLTKTAYPLHLPYSPRPLPASVASAHLAGIVLRWRWRCRDTFWQWTGLGPGHVCLFLFAAMAKGKRELQKGREREREKERGGGKERGRARDWVVTCVRWEFMLQAAHKSRCCRRAAGLIEIFIAHTHTLTHFLSKM